MKFWDSSGIVPLLIEESRTACSEDILKEDSSMVVWWATEIECHSALCRKLRTQEMTLKEFKLASEILLELSKAWIVIRPVESLITQCKRILRVHSLRAADAFQLAAALEFCARRPSSLGFVSGDVNLLASADAEGFVCWKV